MIVLTHVYVTLHFHYRLPFSFTGLSEVVMEYLLYIVALVVLIIAWYVYSSFYVFNPFDASSLVLIVLLFYV